MPDITLTVDCDVIQADGGTRTASINGAAVALMDAIDLCLENKTLRKNPLVRRVAAVSVGIVEQTTVLDLDYSEDSNAETDMNVVMDDNGEFIEVQGTAEKGAFSLQHLNHMLTLARDGCTQLLASQETARKSE